MRELRRQGSSFHEIGVRFGVGHEAEPPSATPDPEAAADDAAEERAGFIRMLDAIDHGIAFYDGRGDAIHRNATIARWLDDAPVAETLERALQSVVDSTWTLARERALSAEVVGPLVVRDVAAAHVRFRCAGAFCGMDLFGSGPSLMVTVDALAVPVSDETLRDVHNLTPQEARIARLLAEGRPNAYIADRLQISPHTARRHTERVLRKLGAHSRSEVAARLIARIDPPGSGAATRDEAAEPHAAPKRSST